MTLSRFACAAVLAAAFAQQASALSEDDKSMNEGGAANFSDPDEHTPGQAVYMQGGKAANGDNTDPSSVRYDYDPASGSYVPHTK